ncbi:MAG: Asp-tRNA(Asn)/Glu-tRNA(Gln) amidotransferase GatCAB subunit B [Elusimicrobia bacterium HGW-Elusimicrobia-4]|nr:MAG: Asp-tRNA(Asn)/Glu-tRNA(Gln) amidotransferase GatCAB subunit B [Elusimicrobia bacterium HGW-Elusimicrobia-4]
MNYETVIGLEVHVHLKTKSKLFCGCSTEFGSVPNSNICPVCTGQPGALPVLNKKAVEFAVLTGLATNCKIAKHSIFARKNYFYPDLPKNYQISQYELPLCEKGFLEIEINGIPKKIGITRIHLEEDAGKLLHAIGSQELDYSLVDYNRTGIPLLEIVSEPDISSPDEAYQYLTNLKAILRYIGISDCDMEKGSLRCDANISLRSVGEKKLGVKVELKNMNSFKAIRDALNYEIERQTESLNSGEKILQDTRLWDEKSGATVSMRSKEQAHDYRYFPEPDLAPVEIDEKFLDEIRKNLVELPKDRKKRFIEKFGFSDYDAGVLTSEKSLADYFESVVNIVNEPKLISNWITTELLGKLNSENKDITSSSVSSENLAGMLKLISDSTISGKIAKTVFEQMYNTGKNASEIVKEQGLVQISDEKEIEKFVDEALAENQKAVAEYKSGKQQVIGALVGSVMKKSRSQANPKLVNEILIKKLK